KASAVRALGLVPVPSSLARFLESGSGVAAGGSALFGSSFVLKALVAVVAGGALTGVVGRTQIHGAHSAASPVRQIAPVLVSKTIAAPMPSVAPARRHVVLRAAVDPVARADRARRVVAPNPTVSAG